MSDDNDAVTPLQRTTKIAKCIICCPCNCAVDCAIELKDTCIYCALCPQRCMEERKRKKKARKEKNLTRAEEYKLKIKKCCTPSPDCCGFQDKHQEWVCCFISPKNWCLLCCGFFLFYLFVGLFWIGLMLIYLALGSYTPFNS